MTASSEPTASELAIARRMARDGATMREIHARLGWECPQSTTRSRLLRYGVAVSGGRAHRGLKTSLPGDYRQGRDG